MAAMLVLLGFVWAVTLRYVLRNTWHWLWRLPPPAHAVHFSPKGGCTEAVVREVGQARREILVLAYSFTSRPISEALVAARRRGVIVEMVLDHSNENEPYTDLPYLLEHGLRPMIDPEHAIAHNKVMIIDGHTLVTGSFNFTHQAEAENAENLLVLRNYLELARSYRENFFSHRSHARTAQVRAEPARRARAA